jgi:hypothetical protein
MTNPEAMVLRHALGGREAGRGKRYPMAMRDRVIAFALSRREEGRSWASIATELGVHFETLRCWCVKSGSKPARMRAVRVVDSVAGRTVAVVSPNGYRVPEVSIEEAVAILRAVG